MVERHVSKLLIPIEPDSSSFSIMLSHFLAENFGTIEAEIEHLLELAQDGLHLR